MQSICLGRFRGDTHRGRGCCEVRSGRRYTSEEITSFYFCNDNYFPAGAWFGSVSFVYFPSVPDLDNHYNKAKVLNFVYNSVPAMANSLILLAGKFHAPGRTWIITKSLHLLKDLPHVICWNRLRIFADGRPNDQFIFGHDF